MEQLGATSAAYPGIVTGRPLTWLRIEAAALAVVGIALFATTDQPWWLMLALFLVPDLAAIAYVAGASAGAWAYNLTHSLTLPLLLFVWSLAEGPTWLDVAVAVWLFHIGFDRVLKYGLKYDHSFDCTHLGMIGKSKA